MAVSVQQGGLLTLFDQSGDVAKVQQAGHITATSPGTFEVSASGANIWAPATSSTSRPKRVTGDVELVAAVEFGDSATPRGAAKGAPGAPDPHRKAGLMIRASREPDAPSADAMVHGDNNHGYSTDGRSIALSCGARGESRVHVVAAAGGQPRVLTEQTPSYWHGWSPDGRTLAFVGRRDASSTSSRCPWRVAWNGASQMPTGWMTDRMTHRTASGYKLVAP